MDFAKHTTDRNKRDAPSGGVREVARWASACAVVLAVSTGSVMAAREKPTPAPVPSPRPSAIQPGHPTDVSDSVPKAGRGDSIYAKEISIDAGGITVIDRDGQRRHWLATSHGLTGLPVPPDEPGVVPPGGWGDIGESHAGQLSNFVLVGNITIEPDDVAEGDAVGIFCDIHVRGRVAGDVVMVFGDIDVEGSVDGSVVAPFGQVHIGPEGYIRSDVNAARVVREPGGRIGGRRQETHIAPFGGEGGVFNPSWGKPTITILVALKAVFWVFLVLVAYALAAKNIAKVKDRVRASFFKSFMVGVLAQILILPLFLLLVVTIVGIPLAIFLLPLMMFAGLILAQAAVGQYVGELIGENTTLALRTPLARTIVGVSLLQAVAILTVVVIWAAGPSELGGFFRVTTFILFSLSVLVGYVVMTLGTGAVVSTRFGTRPKEIASSPVPAAVQPDFPGATPLPISDTKHV